MATLFNAPSLHNYLSPPTADVSQCLTVNRGLKWPMPQLQHHNLTSEVAPIRRSSTQRLRFFLLLYEALCNISPHRSVLHRFVYARSSYRVCVSEDLIDIAPFLLFAIATFIRLGLHDFHCVLNLAE